jgi:hypothetical protein
MADRRIDYATEEQPNYEKRRRPERCSQFGPVRRAAVRARSRSTSSAVPRSGSPVGGFHRRIIKKPFFGMG